MKAFFPAISAPFIYKLLFLAIVCTFCSLTIQAQTITDNAFASAVREVCPTCIDASNKLQAPATTLTVLDVSNKSISDLTGIEGFTSLKSLSCHSNKLAQLPSLPSSLTTLLCDVNQLTTLPTLPAGLTNLSCSYNQLPFLPNLPSSLTALACNNNQLTTLPALPSTLKSLTCSNNQLNTLPATLPTSLTSLFCLANKLTELPTLPNGLTTLYCQDNQVSCLPTLPNSLSVLYIDTDKISCLPNAVSGLKIYNAKGNLVEGLSTCVKIPDPKFAEAIRSYCPQCIDKYGNLTPYAANLQSLYISNGGITSLEGIQHFSALQSLYCGRNSLKTLPDNLPLGLKDLSIDYNELSVLPKLPSGLTRLNCSNNPLTTIENLPSSLEALFCNQNKLTQLQNLPTNLTYLNCQENFLTALPTLPSTIITLIANKNKLASLPSLPNKLEQIEVGLNQLTKIPTLPNKLYSLDCNGNPLECLPLLPLSMRSLNINNTKITCVPNKPNGIYVILNGVNVPVCGFNDPNLTASVRQTCPTCFDECGRPNATEISKIKSLDLSNKNISNIAEIELFTSLETLNLSNNPSIKCISTIPTSLTSLTIDTTTIRCLPSILPSLKVYSSSGGLLINYPTCVTINDIQFANAIRNSCSNCINECNQLLPNSKFITNLNCHNVQDLTHIDKFISLVEFSCFSCNGTELPKLPDNIEVLSWVNGKLKKLSNLPKKISLVNVNNNSISEIETLPVSLKQLNISINVIQDISNLPSSLEELICSANQIRTINNLPINLKQFDCSNNYLSMLPTLPSGLISLSCYNNYDLTCLPLLPNSLRSIFFNNKIECLPNKPTSLNINGMGLHSFPICEFEDINFIKAIQEQCPTCLDPCFKINQSSAEKIKSIDLSNKEIVNLGGLELFTSLEILNLSNTQINCIRSLPNSLLTLIINPEKIKCLPKHNINLKVYNANGVQIETPPTCTGRILDENFANAIRRQCPGCLDECNSLLPEALEIESLSLDNSSISDLSGIEGFKFLKNLNCNNNLLTSVPTLPSGLLAFSCQNNKLTDIGSLPKTLKILSANRNSMSMISETLPSTIEELNISNNKFSSLPVLPISLKNLNCSNNNLSKLPELPLNLEYLDCSQNINLACLPYLPNTLKSLYIFENNNINCIPNRPANIYIYTFKPDIGVCSIPDENFQKAIQDQCTSCFDECQRLITSEAEKITVLKLDKKNISNLKGIELFKNLDSLIISNNPLTCLPPLPENINSITIDTSTIKCITSSNSKLRVYTSNGQRIPKPIACKTYVPDINFAKAIRSNCSTCIDDCNYLLPLASTLISLSISFNNITDLTGIEGFTSLQYLYTEGNKLTFLPSLPSTLRTLSIGYNKLQSVTTLPDNLKELYISNNLLTQLPVLPSKLQRLDFNNNKISSVTTLPSTLIELRCSGNQITCLPSLPFVLSYLQFDSNKIGCLKNFRSGISLLGPATTFQTYPECSNPIILSEVTSSVTNPVLIGTTVPLAVKRNYTGTVSLRWQRKRSNESEYSDLKLDTIATTANTDFTYEINSVTMTDNGSSYRLVVTSACAGTFVAKAFALQVKDESIAPPTITASPRDTVCLMQTIRLTSSCPAGTTTVWSTNQTGQTLDLSSSTVSFKTLSARCEIGTLRSENGPTKTVAWKPFNVTLINVGKSKSAVKAGTNVPLSDWTGQFITPDAGPDLAKSTNPNPSIYYSENPNKLAPRFWTAYVDLCGIEPTGSISFDLLAHPETSAPISFNTHENNAPYLMYANRDGFTELYAQNHPYFGFYLDNGNNQNRYDSGLPKGLYKLSIRYWSQKGLGLTPSVRTPQGTALTYQEHWFRIQSKSGVGTGSGRMGLEPNEASTFINVSPNPASKSVNLSIQYAKHQVIHYEWVDMAGRVHQPSQFTAETDAHTEQIDISNFPTGLYFLRVTTPTQRVHLKVTKLD